MEALVETRKIGGSLVVTLPKTVVREEGISEHQFVMIDIRPVPRSGFGIFRGIGPFSPESKLRGQLEE